MIIYTEFLDSLDTGIHQPQSILLATSEAKFRQASVVDAGAGGDVASAVTACKVHLSVDQVVVGWRSNKVFVCKLGTHNTFKDGEVSLVIIVIECHRANIHVVGIILWAVYYLATCQQPPSFFETRESEIKAYQRTPKTICILARVMRVIECTAIRSGFERVREAPTRRYWTHGYSRDAICPLAALLEETMPMHGGTFSRPGDGIVHGDLNSVSPVGFDRGLMIEP